MNTDNTYSCAIAMAMTGVTALVWLAAASAEMYAKISQKRCAKDSRRLRT